MLKSFQHYIDGEFSDAAQTFDSINPATGAVWATMPAASTADVDRAPSDADLGALGGIVGDQRDPFVHS